MTEVVGTPSPPTPVQFCIALWALVLVYLVETLLQHCLGGRGRSEILLCRGWPNKVTLIAAYRLCKTLPLKCTLLFFFKSNELELDNTTVNKLGQRVSTACPGESTLIAGDIDSKQIFVFLFIFVYHVQPTHQVWGSKAALTRIHRRTVINDWLCVMIDSY